MCPRTHIPLGLAENRQKSPPALLPSPMLGLSQGRSRDSTHRGCINCKGPGQCCCFQLAPLRQLRQTPHSGSECQALDLPVSSAACVRIPLWTKLEMHGSRTIADVAPRKQKCPGNSLFYLLKSLSVFHSSPSSSQFFNINRMHFPRKVE